MRLKVAAVMLTFVCSVGGFLAGRVTTDHRYKVCRPIGTELYCDWYR